MGLTAFNRYRREAAAKAEAEAQAAIEVEDKKKPGRKPKVDEVEVEEKTE